MTELQAQMLTSTELIKDLADQNAQLIRRIEVNRVRVLWLAAATVGLGVVVLVGLLLILSR